MNWASIFTVTKWKGVLLLATLLTSVSCAAEYQTLFKKQGAGAGDKNDTDTVEAQGPTAAIEVIFQGQSVTQVPAGRNFMIQPTEDTKDLDNPDQPNCRNVGIVKVVYSIEGTVVGESTRNGSCTDLMINQKIDQPGEYTITMVVTSDDAETAEASMTLSVVDPNGAPEDQVPGFRIDVGPNPANIGQTVTFEGFCDSADVILIRWKLGDGSTREGATFTYSYSAKGSYIVEATCEIADVNEPLVAKTTVVITGNGDGNDGNGDGNDGNGDGNDGDGDGNDGNGDGNDGNGDGNDGNGDGNDGNGDGNDGSGDGNDGNGGQDGGDSGKGGDDVWDDEDDNGVGDPGQTDPGQNPSQI